MIGIAVSFPCGRFHATPWGRHVNEGIPEWPPSSWRFLRALVATWKRKLSETLNETEVELIIRQLLEPPEYVLPKASTGHARHYMPWFKKGPDDRTLVFDTFVVLPRSAEMIAVWPAGRLDPKQQTQLDLILEHLNFFGRAESWCAARVLGEREVSDALNRVNCTPLGSSRAPRDGETLRALCADPESVLGNERFSRTEERKRGQKISTVVKRTVTYDPDWHLCAETLWLDREKWSDPPGSRWITYIRRRDCFKIEPVHSVQPRPDSRRMQVARFVLDSSVLPLVTDTLPVAEAARRILMGRYGRMFQRADGSLGRSLVFSGKDENGRPLQGHTHAYYLPTDEDADGRLDHLTIVAQSGFGRDELRVLDRLRELKTAERQHSGHRLSVLLLGLGQLSDYEAGPLRPSASWVSATPFLVTRHLKKNGRKRDPQGLWYSASNFATAVLREELTRLIERRADLQNIAVDEIRIETLVDEQGVFRITRSSDDPQGLRPIQFKRFRQKRGDDGGRRAAAAFRITFPYPVRGPICLGHSCHFGLGLFMPVPR